MKARWSWTSVVVAALLAVPCVLNAGEPVGTAFTYQGQLKEAGLPVNEFADFEFTLWDAAVGGNPVGPAVGMSDIDLINGLFTVVLDFGDNVFTGEARWLEIAVAVPAGSGHWHTLSPRQPITPAPYALFSLNGAGDSPWQSSGSNIFYDTGYVGIGTAEPLADLHVSGNTRMEGTLNIDTSEQGYTVLDQSQTSASLVDHLNGDWQSFTAGVDGCLIRVEVLSEHDWFWGYATLKVYEGEGTGGPLFYEHSYNIGYPPPNGIVTFEIPIEEAPCLAAGSIYTFQITEASALVWLESGDPYSDGTSSFGADYDFWFNTHMNPEYNPGGTVVVTAGGNVGIGTSEPIGTLHVKSSEGNALMMVEGVTARAAVVMRKQEAQWEMGLANPPHYGAAENFGIEDANGGVRLVIDGDGNVGIGTTDPQSKLHIQDGSITIRKSFYDLQVDEWHDIDINSESTAALYAVIVQRCADAPNFRYYLVLFAGSYYGSHTSVLGEVEPGDPPTMYASFRGVGSVGGPYRLQIMPHGDTANVHVTKIKTAW